MEEWRPTHHPNYDVSNLGRVRSRAPRGGDMKRGGNQNPQILRLLRPGIASHGYPTVAIGHGNTCSVHVLVATAFLGPCPPGQEVRHKDDNRQNPRADNLEYGTRTQNILDSVQRGRWHRSRKLTDDQIQQIRFYIEDEGISRRLAAELFGVCRQVIDKVINRQGRFLGR